MTDNEILNNLGLKKLNPMQERAGQAGRDGRNVILLSPTGTGKTLAYLLPSVHRIDFRSDELQAVIVVPSRELAMQSEEVFRKMKTEGRALCLYGGRPAMEEHRKIREVKPQIVFATPGRLLDHLEKENIRGGSVFLLVIDEFDKCLELGFQADMEQIRSHLSAVKQLLLTSATDAEEIPAYMERFGRGSRIDFVRLDYLDGLQLEDRLTVKTVPSPAKDKLETLAQLLTWVQGKPSIVFVSHRESAERIGKYLKDNGFFAEIYHGGMEQERRERALYKFRSGSSNVLVATDLAARGLDIPEVEVIVHYHLPATEEIYIHRCGRATRWMSTGEVYLLKGPDEYIPEFTGNTEDFGVDGTSIVPAAPLWITLYIGKGKKDKLSKADIVGFLCKKGGLRGEEIGRIDVGTHFAYATVKRTKVKVAMRSLAGEKIKGKKTLIEIMRN